MKKNNNNLFYLCSLIEYIGRETKNSRADVINYLGEDLKRIYTHADVFHCEPIEKVADDFITRRNIVTGKYDVLKGLKYSAPDYWDVGEIFERLIEDVVEEADLMDGIKEVYSSWIAEKILNFNSDLYYQSRDYLAECYRQGKVLAA